MTLALALALAPLYRIKGAIIGHALGDALGLPCEFPPIQPYTGMLVQNIHANGFRGTKTFVQGQVSDDTEMAIALTYSIKDGKYSKVSAIKSYIEWADSDCFYLDKNTNALFKGVVTVRGYEVKYSRLISHTMESNCCLMRVYPLGLLGVSPAEDCRLTNPAPICVEATQLYCRSINMALHGSCKEDIYAEAIRTVTDPALKKP
jgi:ADP-ribosylglycohydrolase